MKKLFAFFMVLILACMSVTLVGCQDPINNNGGGSTTNTPSNTGLQISDIASEEPGTIFLHEDGDKYLKFINYSENEHICVYHINDPDLDYLYDFVIPSGTNTVILKTGNNTIATFNYTNENGVKTLTNDGSSNNIPGIFTHSNN